MEHPLITNIANSKAATLGIDFDDLVNNHAVSLNKRILNTAPYLFPDVSLFMTAPLSEIQKGLTVTAQSVKLKTEISLEMIAEQISQKGAFGITYLETILAEEIAAELRAIKDTEAAEEKLMCPYILAIPKIGYLEDRIFSIGFMTRYGVITMTAYDEYVEATK